MRLHAQAILGALLVLGCRGSSGPSDAEVVGQVQTYLADLRCPKGNLALADSFRIQGVAVADRRVQDGNATVVCHVTAMSRPALTESPFVTDSEVSQCFGFLAKKGSEAGGKAFTSDVSFEFEQFDKGWRIRGIRDLGY